MLPVSPPGTGDGSYSSFDYRMSINDRDDVAFRAALTSKTQPIGSVGIFAAERSTPVPTLGGLGVALPCLVLGIAGALLTHRARRRSSAPA